MTEDKYYKLDEPDVRCYIPPQILTEELNQADVLDIDDLQDLDDEGLGTLFRTVGSHTSTSPVVLLSEGASDGAGLDGLVQVLRGNENFLNKLGNLLVPKWLKRPEAVQNGSRLQLDDEDDTRVENLFTILDLSEDEIQQVILSWMAHADKTEEERVQRQELHAEEVKQHDELFMMPSHALHERKEDFLKVMTLGEGMGTIDDILASRSSCALKVAEENLQRVHEKKQQRELERQRRQDEWQARQDEWGKQEREPLKCHLCQGGHLKRNCDYTCSICGRVGSHLEADCWQNKGKGKKKFSTSGGDVAS